MDVDIHYHHRFSAEIVTGVGNVVCWITSAFDSPTLERAAERGVAESAKVRSIERGQQHGQSSVHRVWFNQVLLFPSISIYTLVFIRVA